MIAHQMQKKCVWNDENNVMPADIDRNLFEWNSEGTSNEDADTFQDECDIKNNSNSNCVLKASAQNRIIYFDTDFLLLHLDTCYACGQTSFIKYFLLRS